VTARTSTARISNDIDGRDDGLAHESYDPSDLPLGASHADADAYAADYQTRYARDYAADAVQDVEDGGSTPRRRGGGSALLVAVAAGAVYATARALVRRARHFDYAGRVALVTGGSRGLGLELARQLLDAGARVAICARDADALERARVELTERSAQRGGGTGAVFAQVCDVTDRDDVARLVAAVRASLGEIDVLVNNAGIIQVGPTEQMEFADYDEAMRINFYGPLHLALAVAPAMQQRGSGRIVNISSIGGKFAVPHLVPYSASKFALTGLSEGLRLTLAKHGVYVTTVCPGELRTGSPAHSTFKGDAAAEHAWFTSADSAPVMSMPAPAAARRILRAAQGGDAELVMPALSWLQVKFHGLFPGITADLNAFLDRQLPGPVPGGEQRHAGHEVDDRLPEAARAVQRRAVADFNQGEAFAP
jgi:NAD(P)-dependent dehydrogenase (short-subunit alcohol dehydrogenase family)